MAQQEGPGSTGWMSSVSTGREERGRAIQAKQELPAAGVWQHPMLLEQGCMCVWGTWGEAGKFAHGHRASAEGLWTWLRVILQSDRLGRSLKIYLKLYLKYALNALYYRRPYRRDRKE